MKLDVRTISHDQQRYPTCGDYWTDTDGTIQFRISALPGLEDGEFLILIHELIEQYLCAQAGVSEQAIDQFDMAFERARQPGDATEPGDSILAPYHQQHQIATAMERMLASVIGVDWQDYGDKVNQL